MHILDLGLCLVCLFHFGLIDLCSCLVLGLTYYWFRLLNFFLFYMGLLFSFWPIFIFVVSGLVFWHVVENRNRQICSRLVGDKWSSWRHSMGKSKWEKIALLGVLNSLYISFSLCFKKVDDFIFLCFLCFFGCIFERGLRVLVIFFSFIFGSCE